MEKKKLTVPDLLRIKREKKKIVLLSVPDATTADLAERAGVDIVCLGDSLGMVTLGYSTTIPVTMDDMIRHGQAVRRGAPNTFLLACMPYQSYQTPEVGLHNAARFMQEVGADAVKIQGGQRVKHIIKAISEAGIPCMSHIGLVPHTVALIGGFKVQGRTADDAMKIYDDAFAIQEAGAIGIEIEAIPPAVTETITTDLDIITYGIGAGSECDGQILIAWDMLGFFDLFKPKFVKRYASMAQIAIQAISKYADEVRKGEFPEAEHTYMMDKDELRKFKENAAVKKTEFKKC
jgi:3-methyl-2-oxobutanoate hydroxymethyltransferase